MGCDGGTIPRRDELVKTKKKPETPDSSFKLIHQWYYCHLSQQILQAPVVMCGLGYVYNKIALIEALLDRATLPETVRHIKSLKDVKNLNLTANPEYTPNADARNGEAFPTAPFVCPVTGMEMNGKYRFVGLWSCGCVLSERALKEIKVKTCHKCQMPFNEEDVVVLNGSDEDVVLMKQHMEMRQAKAKKPKCAHSESNSSTKSIRSTTLSKPSSSTLTLCQKPPAKREGDTLINASKKVRKNYSIAQNPQVSEVYKSLFVSHQSEKEQTRAHWITYNPFYN